MILFRTIIATAKSFSAMCERSDFSYRGISLRNRLNQEWASSSTYRRALKVGTRSISFFPLPADGAEISGSGILTLFNDSRFQWQIQSNAAMPGGSGYDERQGDDILVDRQMSFCAVYSRDQLDSALWILEQGGPRYSIRQQLPRAGESPQCIITGQTAPPYISKHPGFGPLLKPAVDHGRTDTLKSFTRQCIPDNSRPGDLHDG